MKFHVLAASVLLAAGTAAFAQQEDENDRPQAEATAAQANDEEELDEEDPGEEVVCRTERITGSLTRRRRTCMTRNEWADLEARTRDDMIRAGRSASGSPRMCNDPASPAC